MPRKYKVTPIEASGRGRISYVAYFRTASGKRVCRGLGTDAGRAKTLCGNLETLWLAGVRDRAGVPSGLEPDAVDLYLDQAAEADPVATMHALPAADDRQTSEERLEAALSEGARWRRLYEEKSIRLEALERSALARLAEAGRRSPPIAEALARFAEHIRTRTTAGNAGTLIQAARRFCASLPAEARTLADVAAEFATVRAASLALFRAFDEPALLRQGTANGFPCSVRALAMILAGHELHHVKLLRERYGLKG